MCVCVRVCVCVSACVAAHRHSPAVRPLRTALHASTWRRADGTLPNAPLHAAHVWERAIAGGSATDAEGGIRPSAAGRSAAMRRVQRRVLHICMPRYPLRPGRSPAGPSSRAAQSRTRATTSRQRRSARRQVVSTHAASEQRAHAQRAHAGSASSGSRRLHPPPAQPGLRHVLARAAGGVRQHAWVGVSHGAAPAPSAATPLHGLALSPTAAPSVDAP